MHQAHSIWLAANISFSALVRGAGDTEPHWTVWCLQTGPQGHLCAFRLVALRVYGGHIGLVGCMGHIEAVWGHIGLFGLMGPCRIGVCI